MQLMQNNARGSSLFFFLDGIPSVNKRWCKLPPLWDSNFVVLHRNSKQERSFQNWETLQQMSITYFSELSGIKRWEWSRFLFNYYSMEDQRYSALLSSKKLIYVPISHSLYYLNFDFLFWIETMFCPKYF